MPAAAAVRQARRSGQSRGQLAAELEALIQEKARYIRSHKLDRFEKHEQVGVPTQMHRISSMAALVNALHWMMDVSVLRRSSGRHPGAHHAQDVLQGSHRNLAEVRA